MGIFYTKKIFRYPKIFSIMRVSSYAQHTPELAQLPMPSPQRGVKDSLV